MRNFTLFTSTWGPKYKQNMWKLGYFWYDSKYLDYTFNNILKTHLTPAGLSLHIQAHKPAAVNAELLPDIFLWAGDHRNCLSPQIRVANQKQAVSSWTCVFPHLPRRCIHAMAWPCPFLLHLLLHQSASSTQAQVAMHWGTPATLSHISSEAKIYWGQNLLLWFIPFLILIISKWCLFFLLFSLSQEFICTSKKSNQTEGNEMQSKSFHCQTTIKCYGHIKAYRARWSAQWEYDILHCAGPHSGLCRQLQKNLTIRKNSL